MSIQGTTFIFKLSSTLRDSRSIWKKTWGDHRYSLLYYLTGSLNSSNRNRTITKFLPEVGQK